MRIRIVRAAQDDLDSQWLYLAENGSLKTVDHFESRVTHVLELLTEQPRMGVARDELRSGLRSFPINA